jgi:hypothetical protein
MEIWHTERRKEQKEGGEPVTPTSSSFLMNYFIVYRMNAKKTWNHKEGNSRMVWKCEFEKFVRMCLRAYTK